MQTFLLNRDVAISASLLDKRRLCKQRVEAIQIAQILLGLKPESRWRHHPAVRMWKGYEWFLVWEYITAHMVEFSRRGGKNIKTVQQLIDLALITLRYPKHYPEWINDDFIEAHRSNLIRKDETFYAPLFPFTIRNLQYVWPK